MTALIDFSQLPAPQVVETLDYEEILTAMLADLRSRDPQFDALVESDPAYKILEVAAFREMLLRQRVNDAGRSVMLAYAAGSDLDQLAALYGVLRLVADPGDPDAAPPVPPTYESDTALRRRVQLAPESWTTAGSVGSYQFHALGAHPEVKDIAAVSPTPGEVLVTVLATSGDGTPAPAVLTAVTAALDADTVRPLTDSVAVQAATIVPYVVEANLILAQGPDTAVVIAAAVAAAEQYVEERHRLGRNIARSGLHAALHRQGVERVILLQPAADLTITPAQAGFCTSLVAGEVGE